MKLAVTMYNINWGYNPELMESCRLLREYAQYVEQVRRFAERMPFAEAVSTAVNYCIRNDILSDFLSRNRAEAIAVSIFEYNEEQHLKSEQETAYRNGKCDGEALGRKLGRQLGHEEGRKEGKLAGREEGLKEGEDRLARLLQLLLASGRNDDINRIISDLPYREKLYKENHL